MSNSFGNIFKITSFGESHGTAVGVVIDGCPSGLTIDVNFIQQQLDKRKPGQSSITTQRKEEDKVQVLSGVFENKSTGAPIALLIYNNDQRTEDYDHLKDAYRPSHADFVYEKKYGIRDYRGGGRSSARVTASCVAAGAVAQLLLRNYGISISGFVSQVGHIKIQKTFAELNFALTEKNSIRCPDEKVAVEMIKYIEAIKEKGDTIGGSVSCVVKNIPVGLGEPVFDKLHADLGKAMLGINAAHGFDYGAGFEGISKTGSELNDAIATDEMGNVYTKSNNSGGIQGGISNGEDVYFRVLFKPVATLMQQQMSINNKSEVVTLPPKGRHDPCVLPRAVPIVEAMAALVIADYLLINRSNRL